MPETSVFPALRYRDSATAIDWLSDAFGVEAHVAHRADAHHDRAKAAGARIVRELQDTDYGSREYSARDFEGNLWSFGTYDPRTAAGPEQAG